MWIEKAIGKMHRFKISNIELAEHLNVSPQYISEILNGRVVKKGAGTKDRILTAINEIIAKKS